MRTLQIVCAALVVALGVGCNDGDSTDGSGNDINLGDGNGDQGGGDEGGGGLEVPGGPGDEGPGDGDGDDDDQDGDDDDQDGDDDDQDGDDDDQDGDDDDDCADGSDDCDDDDGDGDDGDDDGDPVDPATCDALCDAMLGCFPDGGVIVPGECAAECVENLDGCGDEGQEELVYCASLDCGDMMECLEGSICMGDGTAPDPDPASFCEAVCGSYLECVPGSPGDADECLAECSPIEDVCSPEELAPALECASLDDCADREACFESLEEPPCLGGL